jgi:AAA ATPase domain
MSDRRVVSGLVGRERPLERLTGMMTRAIAGERSSVLVAGEAGIGKTSLMRAAAAFAADCGMRVGWGVCADGAGTPGYWPWTQVLNGFVRNTDVGVEQALRLAGDDQELLSIVATATTARGGADASNEAPLLLMDAVTRWLDALAGDRPIMVVLDDLQWADNSTLTLFDFVARSSQPAGVCLVGAYRDDDLSADFRQRISALLTHVDHVQLAGLSIEAMRTLVETVAGGQVPDDVVSSIHRRTAGHPFFARELALLPTQDSLPAAVRDAIERRLRLLGDRTTALLEVAAVAGNDVSPDVVGHVLALSATDLELAIESAATAGILVVANDGHARFAHDLLRETLLAGLAPARRLALHQAIGDALEQRVQRGGRVAAAELASHFTAALAIDGYQRAAHWALAAAAADRAVLAFDDAGGHLRRLRSAVADAGLVVADEVMVDVLVAEADALARAGSALDARGLLRMAGELATRCEDPRRVAVVALATAQLGSQFSARRDEVIGRLERALEGLEGVDVALEARVMATLARELQHSVAENRPRAEPLSRRALELGRQAGDDAALLACLLARHDVLWTPGLATERAAIAHEIATVALRSGDQERHAEGLLLLANAELERGSAAYLPALESCLQLLEDLGQPRHRYTAETRRAAVVLLHGDLEAAAARIDAAAELGARLREPDTGNVRMSQRLELVRAGNVAIELQTFADEAVAHWTGAPVHANAVAAGFHARAGDIERSRHHVATVLDLGGWRSDRSYLWSVYVRELCVAAIALGDANLCRELLEEVVPLAEACGVNGAVVAFAGSHAHTAGLLASALGDHERAVGLLGHARRVYERLGARTWLADVDGSLAVMAPGQPPQILGIDGVGHPTASLIRAGPLWHVSFGGTSGVLPHARGLTDLATLLGQPGRDVHALTLMSSPDRSSSAGAILDRSSMQQYRDRLSDIDDEIDEARHDHDEARAARLDAEREAVLAELRRATTASGRAREFANHPAERARKAVSARIRASIATIGTVLPELEEHLSRTIVTGTNCRYSGDGSVRWDVGVGP